MGQPRVERTHEPRARSMAYHIQRDSFRAMCGRMIGMPGGAVYPGVHVERPEWFDNHPHPELIEPATCKACVAMRARS